MSDLPLGNRIWGIIRAELGRFENGSERDMVRFDALASHLADLIEAEVDRDQTDCAIGDQVLGGPANQ